MHLDKNKIQYCNLCGMPNTRPGSIFKHGICQACINFEKRKNINWNIRYNKLTSICDKYRKNTGEYDCIIPVSGGKDSHRLVHEIKIKQKMNPLLITVGDHFTKTKAGAKNFKNLGKTFGCDHITFDINPKTFIKSTRIGFEQLGEPLKFIEAVIYTMPLKIAIKFKIPLVIFGENSAYEYGSTNEDNYHALGPIMDIFKNIDIDYWLKNGISTSEINSITPPTEEELSSVKPEVIYMSHFIPWSSMKNLEIAKYYGFMDLTHEWIREGLIENFEQIDSVAYIVHLWMKYPKFGFQRTTDIATRRVREGILTLEEAKELIDKNDYKLDSVAMDDFINTLGYTPSEFFDIVDKFWNPKIFDIKKD